jgi:hypothetical protein
MAGILTAKKKNDSNSGSLIQDVSLPSLWGRYRKPRCPAAEHQAGVDMFMEALLCPPPDS